MEEVSGLCTPADLEVDCNCLCGKQLAAAGAFPSLQPRQRQLATPHTVVHVRHLSYCGEQTGLPLLDRDCCGVLLLGAAEQGSDR